jgi:hypothetical protein
LHDWNRSVPCSTCAPLAASAAARSGSVIVAAWSYTASGLSSKSTLS